MAALASIALLGVVLAGAEQRVVVVDSTVELEGTLATYGWINERYNLIAYQSVLLLSAPVSIVGTDGRVLLSGAVLVDMPPADDTMLVRFGELKGKMVRATCKVRTSALFGFKTAFCAAGRVEPVVRDLTMRSSRPPNTSFHFPAAPGAAAA